MYRKNVPKTTKSAAGRLYRVHYAPVVRNDTMRWLKTITIVVLDRMIGRHGRVERQLTPAGIAASATATAQQQGRLTSGGFRRVQHGVPSAVVRTESRRPVDTNKHN